MIDLTSDAWQDQVAQDPEAVIIDVRTAEEIEEGYIPSALHMDIYQPQAFMEAVSALDPNKNYYVYCRSGGRSVQACAVLESVGIATTYNLLGGFTEWDGDVTK